MSALKSSLKAPPMIQMLGIGPWEPVPHAVGSGGRSAFTILLFPWMLVPCQQPVPATPRKLAQRERPARDGTRCQALLSRGCLRTSSYSLLLLLLSLGSVSSELGAVLPTELQGRWRSCACPRWGRPQTRCSPQDVSGGSR